VAPRPRQTSLMGMLMRRSQEGSEHHTTSADGRLHKHTSAMLPESCLHIAHVLSGCWRGHCSTGIALQEVMRQFPVTHCFLHHRWCLVAHGREAQSGTCRGGLQ
jgi:hypothetical protein